MKYLAIVMSTIIVYDFINAGFWQLRIVVLAPIINLLIFFVPLFIKNTSSGVKARKRTQEFESKVLKFEKEDSFIQPIEAMRIWSLDIVLNVMDIMSIVMIIFLIMNINKKIIGLISDYFYVNL